MSNDKIRELLATLNSELHKTEVDDETRRMMQSLDADIHSLLGGQPREGLDSPSLLERAQQMETRFAANHPVAERALREVMDILNRIGI